MGQELAIAQSMCRSWFAHGEELVPISVVRVVRCCTATDIRAALARRLIAARRGGAKWWGHAFDCRTLAHYGRTDVCQCMYELFISSHGYELLTTCIIVVVADFQHVT